MFRVEAPLLDRDVVDAESCRTSAGATSRYPNAGATLQTSAVTTVIAATTLSTRPSIAAWDNRGTAPANEATTPETARWANSTPSTAAAAASTRVSTISCRRTRARL